MAKGGGSANKSFLYQATKAVLDPDRMLAFLDEKLPALGTAACPPYHLAIVVGGTSAEYALKTATYASATYLDALPTGGSPTAHGFRDLDLEAQVLELTRGFGIGAQSGGKYFCHDVRVVRLPRHGGFYLGSIGGPGARLAQDCIKSVDVLDYAELGMEAVWKIEVEDFPAVVVVDDKGNDSFAETSRPVALTIGRGPTG